MPDASDRIDEALGVIGRLVALAVVTLLTLFVIGVALKPLLPLGLPAGQEGRVLFALLIALALVVGHLTVTLMFERSDWTTAGLSAEGWHPLRLGVSLFEGVLVILLPAVALMLTDQLRLETALPGAWVAYAGNALLVLSVLALTEELVFRGYLMGLLSARWGPLAAIAFTSVGFGAYHAFDPGATAVSIAAVTIAGVFLGAVRGRTGSVVAAWLAHLAIDWTQVAVFHSPVSGLELGVPPGYRTVPSGPDWLTGGDRGLEGGAAAAATLVVVIFVHYRARRPASRTTRS